MSYRSDIEKANERISNALAELLPVKTINTRHTYQLRKVHNELRGAQRILEDSLLGPEKARKARIQREVEMTGFEQELPL